MWRWGFKVLNHETGHLLGLPDLYAFKPLTVGSKRDIHYYVGGWDLMGWISGHAPDFFAWSKSKLGWIEKGQVDVVVERGITGGHLAPIEVACMHAAPIAFFAASTLAFSISSLRGLISSSACREVSILRMISLAIFVASSMLAPIIGSRSWMCFMLSCPSQTAF